MAQLALFTAAQFTALQQLGAQASGNRPLDFTIGSDLLALLEGNTSALLYEQANILTIVGLTRAATSNGSDLDSFFADFNFPRLPATYPTGVVQLFRNNTNTVASVIADGNATFVIDGQLQQYPIVGDNSNLAYNGATNTYTCPAGTQTLSVTVLCDTSGPVGNIPVGTQMLIGGTVTGFDSAKVISGLSNGAYAETDTAYRSRFILYLNSLSRGTPSAIGAAIASVQTGIAYTIANNQDPAGNFEPGNFVVTIDDGSGSPPASLIAAVDKAVSAYQANTVSHSTRGPVLVYATVGGTVTLAAGTDPTAIMPMLNAAATAYINGLTLGQSLSVTRLSNVIYTTSSAVVNVSNILINGVAADLIASKVQTIKLAANGLTLASVVSS